MKKTLLLISAACLCLASCNKEEGLGGNNSISGSVYKIIHNDDDYTLQQDTVPAGDVDVYIQFGDQQYYGEREKTGKDGRFRFQYLTTGNYTIYAFSEMPSGEKIAEQSTISVTSTKTDYNVNTIYINEGKAYGTSMIKGSMNVTYFDGKGATVGEGKGEGTRVYIQRKGASATFDDVRVGIDGTFVFRRITPGAYEVFTLSQDPLTEIPSVVKREVVVTKSGMVVEISSPFSLFLKA